MLATDESRREHELLLAHLETEDAHDLALVDRGVLGEVESQAGLADGGARCDQDEVGLLQARGECVEVREAGADATDLAFVLVQVVEPVVGAVQQGLQRSEAGFDPLLADREELRLGTVDDLADVTLFFVADAGDLAGGADEVPQYALALHDAGVLDSVEGRGREVDEARQVGRATDLVEMTLPFEDLAHGDDVDRLATLVELQHRCVDRAVVLAIEVLGLQQLGYLDDRVLVDEQRAQDGLLGFDGLRR